MDISERIKELMLDKYDPYDPDNLAESLANLNREQAAQISELLRAKQGPVKRRYRIGLLIDEFTVKQWRDLAAVQADCEQEREQDEACPKCGGNHGNGCSACDAKLRREARE